MKLVDLSALVKLLHVEVQTMAPLPVEEKSFSAVGTIPLCVDLDGTLVKTDTLIEAALVLIKKSPTTLFAMILWLIKGRAYLKHELARRSPLRAESLPYDRALLKYLQSSAESGRYIVLATAADEVIAKGVSAHLQFFSAVFASDGRTNLKAAEKRATLEHKFGYQGFDYAGNSSADLPVWAAARRAILVQTPRGVKKRLIKQGGVLEREFHCRRKLVALLLRAMRIHQWAKNTLVFVPLILAHQTSQFSKLGGLGLAFLSFSLIASGIYILNDLLDLPSDRQNSSKCRRPFAAGDLPLSLGIALVPGLVFAGLGLSLLLPLSFTGVAVCYVALTMAYSLWIKQRPILDVVMLASLYSVRILAGGTAAQVYLSPWIFAFSTFIFLSLALAKRCSELCQLQKRQQSITAGRGYSVTDLDTLSMMGVSSGYVSAFVLALYMNSPESAALYRHGHWLWLVCPLVVYWISRVWLLTRRGELHEDPVLFALRDRTSYVVAFFILAVLAFAS